MNRKQKDRHEYKMYCKGLRYGARYEDITMPSVRELFFNKNKRRRQQIFRYYERYPGNHHYMIQCGPWL